ncbi:MAG TPA: tetratricopeptide repeat protein [Gemmatales bacterium]|nr:tetratricopeptide repeat protein [Gemmatales bacterium]
MMRVASIPASPKTPPSLLRLEYQASVDRLLAEKKQRAMKAAELADLGALFLRLGQTDAAIDILRPAAAQFPGDFALHANLGSAWHLAGNWAEAAEHLRQAVKLAPPELKPLEALHLKLVLVRLRQTTTNDLEPLFDLQFTTKEGQHRLGRITAQERDKLPKDMVALTQRLALSFPNDGKLLWQLGEQAALFGDLANASMILDICVGEYAMADPELRKSRQAILAALEGTSSVPQTKVQEAHTGHGSGARLEFRSRKPLIQQPFDVAKLAGANAGQPSLLAWPILAETATDPRRFKPTFHPYLQKLDEKQVTLTGFLHPLTDDLDCTTFLLVEYPVGCWYCTAPDLTGIVFITMKPGTTARFTRDVITVTGAWKLNGSDPEEFLFSIVDASVQVPK